MARPVEIERIRNIGIIAHIDAGKTTVTERVLYYTGVTYKIGEVHEGTATMDWMEQERERGITITSAATTAQWHDHIDQHHRHAGPRRLHSRSRAQPPRTRRRCGLSSMPSPASNPSPRPSGARPTATSVPRICFVNKMDRTGANFERTMQMMVDRLAANPIPIQIPVGFESDFEGVIDLVAMCWWSFGGDKRRPARKDATSPPTCSRPQRPPATR